MGFLDIFKKKKIASVAHEQVKSAKQVATEKGEPYFEIISMDVDPNDINSGAFEFDWNDKMIADQGSGKLQNGANEITNA